MKILIRNYRFYLKRLLFLTSFFLYTTLCQGQFIEFGGGIGAMNYSGDLVRGYQISNANMGGTVFYRMNFTPYLSTRMSFTIGQLSGSDIDPIDPFAIERRNSFNLTIAEIGGAFEYHFLDYKNKEALVKWSPYVMVGFGIFRMLGIDENPNSLEYNLLQPSIPIGIGFKHLVGKRFSAGIEFGLRKTFTDYLDNVADGDLTIKNYQYGNPKDKDWYSYAGISISYIIWDIPCPFPYRPNGAIMRQ